MKIDVQKMIDIHRATLSYNLVCFAENADPENYKVDYFEGEPGIGKTSGVRQAAAIVSEDADLREYVLKKTSVDIADYFVRPVIAAQHEGTDLGGLPWAKGDTMVKLRPDMIPQEGAGSLFFDEVSKAKQSTMNVLGQWTLERRVGEHGMGGGWSIVLAGNRRQDRSGDAEVPRFLLDRCSVYEVGVSSDKWLEWAMENGIDPTVIWYLKNNRDHFQAFDPASKVNPTARSWHKVSNYIRSGMWQGNSLRATVEATVGDAVGHQFFAFLSIRDELPDVDKVLADPKNAPVPSSHQARYALLAALAGNVQRKTMKGFNEYLKRFDREVENGREAAVFCTQMVRGRDKSLFMTEDGMDMLERYSELVLG